jgi:gamma-glutamyltranspeptidase / glutathione hydrolase
VLERWGRLSLRDVLRPAIELAENGYPAHSGALGTIESGLKLYPTTAQVVRPPHPPEIGELLRLPDWASTFQSLLKAAEAGHSRGESIRKAKDFFYRGEITHRIVDFVRTTQIKDSAGEHTGLLTYEDLAQYDTPIEEPVSVSYRDHQVYKCGPWTQGPVFLQQLKLLEGFNLQSLGHNSADYIHTVVEAAKLAYADRDAYYGDPRFVQVPLDRLLSDAYASQRRDLIEPTRASMELRPGGGTQSLFLKRTGLPGGFDDTTHMDACDEDGNMIAATASGGWLNMSPIIPGVGFPLSVRGQMFWLDPQHPNCIQPGKRPRTTITPSLVLHKNQPLLAFGTLGGDDQDQWTLQFFLNYLEFGMNLQEALDAPTFNTEHFHESWSGHKVHMGLLSVESRISPAVLEELRRRGHKVTVAGPWSNGRVLAIRRDMQHGIIEAAASPRGETGYAIGW